MSLAALKWAVPGVLALLLLAAGATWKAQDWRYGKQLAEQSGLYQTDLTTISNAAAAHARTALEKQLTAEKARDDIDVKATKEKAHDLAENERLRRAADDSARRLRIAGSCHADSGYVPDPARAPGVDDGGAIELSATAGRTVFDIRAGIIVDQTALRALQAYVRDVCSVQLRGYP
ncbi:hypothetical protein PS918_03148 [Pseudomonas fluorescens]|uniref:Lysis protein n=1 Tax=Pseudomonas fluorescens TaxID=294 RepID=A0A5E7SUM4_PSEFL|nr:lysis system i-spanin subunit Rz [Pseudomonas fluorescens]VVP90089.1 hypothetical protein PS918_03148 [Pseudomonas fluorescens]